MDAAICIIAAQHIYTSIYHENRRANAVFVCIGGGRDLPMFVHVSDESLKPGGLLTLLSGLVSYNWPDTPCVRILSENWLKLLRPFVRVVHPLLRLYYHYPHPLPSSLPSSPSLPPLLNPFSCELVVFNTRDLNLRKGDTQSV